MPILPEVGTDWDIESEGSRFTSRPAVALLLGEVPERELGALDAESIVRERASDSLLSEDRDLGPPRVVDGGIGRGAEGWAPVLEWLGHAAGTGLVGALSWEVLRVTARGVGRVAKTLLEPDTPRVYVSRGFAAHLAIDAVVSNNPTAVLSIEAAEEPSAIAGYPTQELNYVRIEPWIVFLVDFDARKRFIVVVRPTGEIAGHIETDLEECEEMYSQIPRSAK